MKKKEYVKMTKEEYNNNISEVIEQTTDYIIKQTTEKTNKQFNDLKRSLYKTFEDIINNEKYYKEYVEALNYLNWIQTYSWQSDVLMEETLNKKHADLYYTQKNFITLNLNSYEEEKYHTITIDTKNEFSTVWTTNVSIDRPYYREEERLKEVKAEEVKPVKVKYTEKVIGVIEYPWKYSKQTVFNVMEYLKSQLEKDLVCKKYC